MKLERRHTVALVLTLVLGAVTGAAGGNITEFLEIRRAGGEVVERPGGGTAVVDIDADLDLVWDKPALLGALAERLALEPVGEDLAHRIAELDDIAKGLLTLERQRLDALSADLQWWRARADTSVRPQEMARLEQMRISKENLWSATGRDLLNWLAGVTDTHFVAAIDSAVLEDSYVPLSLVVQGRMLELAKQLETKIAAAAVCEVRLRARLSKRDGGSHALHLDNYDDIATGDPIPFGQRQWLFDERTRRELEAAGSLRAVVEDIASGEFGRTLDHAVDELRDTCRLLLEETALAVTSATFDRLAEDLIRHEGEAARILADTAHSLAIELRAIGGDLESIVASGDLDLPTLVKRLETVYASVSRLVVVLPRRITDTLDGLNELRGSRIVATADIQAAVDEAAAIFSEWRERAQRELLEPLRDLIEAATIGDALAAGAEALVAQRIGPDAHLDSHLSLLTVRAERHPGDMVTIQIEVIVRSDGDRPTLVLGRSTRRLRLEKYGPYAETRGALTFISPRSDIPRDIDWSPVPSLAVQLRWGIEGFDFWNRFLQPGVGVSFALLDFRDDKDFEFGIAAHATAIYDLFWIGYGRNLQARADYFYLGVNPLVVTGLLSKSVKELR